MTTHLSRGLTTGLLLLPAAAFAHPGHEASTFLHGLAHSLGGIDHLLAMIAVGILASRFEGPRRWALPLAFIIVMTVGAVIAATSIVLPAAELMIALSLVVFGAGIVARSKAPAALAFFLVGAFALFHGYAHGAESIGSSLLAFGGGFIVSTAALHGAALLLTLRAHELGQKAQTAIRICGGVIAGTGVALLSPFV